MKTVLVPIDFSPITRRVCTEAIALAKAIKGRVVLLHSTPPPVMVSDMGPSLENIVELTDLAQKTAGKQLARVQKKAAQGRVTIKSVLLNGAPGPLILEQATKVRADYIVLGSHGHTAFYDLLVGSTTQQILKHSRCPVLVVPPPQKQKAAPANKKSA